MRLNIIAIAEQVLGNTVDTDMSIKFEVRIAKNTKSTTDYIKYHYVDYRRHGERHMINGPSCIFNGPTDIGVTYWRYGRLIFLDN